MLRNPFTPSEIASQPDEFFGRHEEIGEFERCLSKGSVAIQGPIGIGKSSLLARGLLHMEGFDSDLESRSVTAVGHKDIITVDHAARLLLEQFVRVDEKANSVKLSLGKVLEFENSELVRFFVDNRHLEALNRIIEADYIPKLLDGRQFLILAIDEADKCPVAVARLVRAVLTNAQLKGVKNLRFAVAGVSPFYRDMVNEDGGISRFFYKTLTLEPMPETEARELLGSKIETLTEAAEEDGIPLTVDPVVIDRMIELSGGHPHLLQLLGSHVVQHEDADPDDTIDDRDLVNALKQICYEDRANVYDSTVHNLEVNGKLDTLKLLLGMATDSPKGIVNTGFPTRIDRDLAQEAAPHDSIQWLVEHNILSASQPDVYTLLDEFLRIRLVFDALESEAEREELEHRLLESGQLGEDDDYYDQYFGEQQ